MRHFYNSFLCWIVSGGQKTSNILRYLFVTKKLNLYTFDKIKHFPDNSTCAGNSKQTILFVIDFKQITCQDFKPQQQFKFSLFADENVLTSAHLGRALRIIFTLGLISRYDILSENVE